MTYQAVLFDLDGTLLDTLDDLADSMNAVLAANGWPAHPVDAYRTFVGDGVVELVRRALPEDQRGEETLNRAVQQMRGEYHQRWDCKTRPYDGVAEMLDALSERGVAMAVLSNKPHDMTETCVRRLLGDWTFAAIPGVAADVPPKPDPAGTAKVCRALDIPAERFVYLGDTDTDMKTATAAGTYAVGAAWGFRAAEELSNHGARRVIDAPTELLELF